LNKDSRRTTLPCYSGSRSDNYQKIVLNLCNLNSYLHLISDISAPKQNFKNLTKQFHHIHLMNHHAKFQPPSSSSLAGDSWNRRTKFYFTTSFASVACFSRFLARSRGVLLRLTESQFVQFAYGQINIFIAHQIANINTYDNL